MILDNKTFSNRDRSWGKDIYAMPQQSSDPKLNCTIPVRVVHGIAGNAVPLCMFQGRCADHIASGQCVHTHG